MREFETKQRRMWRTRYLCGRYPVMVVIPVIVRAVVVETKAVAAFMGH